MNFLKFLFLLFVSHYVHFGATPGYSAIAQTQSITSPDTAYYQLIDTTSASARIHSDSVEIFFVSKNLSQVNCLTYLILTDTLADTVYVNNNNVLVYKNKVAKGSNALNIQFLPSKALQPNKLTFYVGLKTNGSSRVATKQRYMPYYWIE